MKCKSHKLWVRDHALSVLRPEEQQVLTQSSLWDSQPLDYETHPVQSLVIAVDNEEPLFPCEEGQLRGPRGAGTRATVSVQVTDSNDPPAFHPRSFVVSEADGARPGIQLGAFNATDPDGAVGRIR